MNLKKGIKSIVVSSLFSYETPKVVQIESKFIGVLNRVMQMALFIITVVWVFILNKGYQYIDTGAVGGTTTKIKGIAYSNSSDPRVGRRVWDSADLHIPPQDNGAFFLTTNVIITSNQSQTVCPGVKAECKTNDDCLPIGKPYHLGNGVTTGVCNMTTKTCLIEAWCPLENDSQPANIDEAILAHTSDFTVLIKNYVYFPFFDMGRSNLIKSVDIEYLKVCKYDPKDHPYCPIFKIGDIVNRSRSVKEPTSDMDDVTYYKNMAVKGGVITITIKWDCNFDYSETKCKPKYSFKRLDNQNGNSAPGYNFRYPYNYREDGIHKRQLIKAYGILFLINTEATARAFDFKTFILNIGSCLALLGIAAICSNIILLHMHKNREYFKKFIMDSVTVKRRVTETRNSTWTENYSDICEKAIAVAAVTEAEA